MNTKHNNLRFYEVSHDYIAQSFIHYAETEMPRNVKSSLDGYKSEYVRNKSISARIFDYGKKWKTSKLALGVLVLSFSLSILAYTLSKLGVYSHIPGYVLTLSLLALLYVYEFYVNITVHHANGKSRLIAVLYFCAMAFGTAASLFPTLWLSFLGIGNFIQGSMSLLVGNDKRVLSLARKMFQAYGVRTVTMGVLLAVCPLILWGGKMAIKDEIVKAVLMGALLGYSYLTHLNKEFFYAHSVMLFSSDV